MSRPDLDRGHYVAPADTMSVPVDVVRIDAKRGDEVPEAWQTRRDTGAVSRYGLEIRLTPRLDGTRATASLEDGVLRLHVPVREEAKPKQIEVN